MTKRVTPNTPAITPAPLTPEEATLDLLRSAEHEWGLTRDTLAGQMKWLGDTLVRKALQVAAAPVGREGAANSLGEVQASGREIDRLCAVLAEQATTIKRLQWLLSEIRKGAKSAPTEDAH